MARKMTEWPSKRGPITKFMPSDGCIGDTVPLAVGKWYDFHEFGWYMGNVGSMIRISTTLKCRLKAATMPSESLLGIAGDISASTCTELYSGKWVHTTYSGCG